MAESNLTFNLIANNGNCYRGHEPKNGYSNCWSSDGCDALVFTLKQIRQFIYLRRMGNIEICPLETQPLTDEQFDRELWCAEGHSWYDYRSGD